LSISNEGGEISVQERYNYSVCKHFLVEVTVLSKRRVRNRPSSQKRYGFERVNKSQLRCARAGIARACMTTLIKADGACR
jgi:hypothetical protein